MGPRGLGGLCLALLGFGLALGFQEEQWHRNVTEEGHGNVTEEGTLETPGQPSTAPGDGDIVVTTWPRATTSPPGDGDITGTPAGNQTRVSPGVPARYWSPVIFVLLALLVLFVTYHRRKDRGIQDQIPSGSDSSDLGALVQSHDLTPKFPTPEGDPGTPPGPELSETPLGQPGKRSSVMGATEPTDPKNPTEPKNPTDPKT